jgi:hypothetical protein
VLLPAHIVFLEFIIDPICSIAFEAERRSATHEAAAPLSGGALFSWRIWMVSLLQGLAVLTAVTVASCWPAAGASEAGTARWPSRRWSGKPRAGAEQSLLVPELFATLREPNRRWP